MRMRINLLAGLFILMAAQVAAQSFGIGPQIGYFKTKDADKGSFMRGAAWRMKLLPVIGVEASIQYRQEEYADGALTVRSWPVMVTGLIYPLPVVYGAVGAGWYSVTSDYDQKKVPILKDDTSHKVGWHFGGGLEVPVVSKIKLTGDIRYVFLNYDFEKVPGSSDMKSNFTVMTVGLLFGL